MDKRWTLAIVTLLMVLLVYSFLTMVLKTDKKKNSHSRLYRDYSSYNKKQAEKDYYSSSSNIYGSTYAAERDKRHIFKNVMSASLSSYNMGMELIRKNSEGNKISPTNSQYDQMMKLARKTVPEYQLGILLYKKGEYEDAASKLNDALEKLDPMEMKNRAEIYGLLAECYIKLKNDEGYIQNKVRFVRMQRKINKIKKDTFPDLEISETAFLSTEEASTNLLRVKSSVARLPDSPMVRDMVKKAELDLEVARKVSQ